ncbi:YigZ family protein [Tetragenococcus halophilus]|mgnify:FL=1|uniref:YigZ family protein n=2 Tax=Tetragenococcus halophilus TaxID=51669 RepID=A0A2H6DMR5_TETHA|nr:YigZ family protein [Tetragenococcus halophilus]MCF1675077.1 YigZ family protein [Tetragenococcus halophilus]MCO8283684.1 YigZ family protein [Tetragenococcus halophilus]MCO8298446.1 YigZ family protein [Tetragenococcus halophilus]MDN5831629.1 YigZ family protein [Tetragenococcus halophilus]MDN6112673.1 YigZ family protein [Tetragenococcus halophilus]
MLESYRTIQKDGQSELEIKKSRFICSLKRVYTEDEAKAFIQELKKKHWKANHNCSAFLIGEENEIQRSSDDGEPSGTAGNPMLEVLKKQELINVCAVVTRYFGGTKLGAGGLIRAYSHSVSHALEETKIVQGILQEEIYVTIDYPLLGKLQNFLEQQEYMVANTEFLEKVTLCVLVENLDTFIEAVTELLNDQASFEKGEKRYHEHLIKN